MKRLPILTGAYQARSIIASAQRCVNLYPELNEDKQAPVPVTHYPTPGLIKKWTPPAAGVNRCVYRASNGQLFTVVDDKVFYVNSDFVETLLGTIAKKIVTPIVMADNGISLILVDGSTTGYAIDLTTHAFAVINDPNFLGGTRVDYVDTFFVLNVPNTNQWYISLSNVTFGNLTAGTITPPNIYAAFDPLDIVAKSGNPDPISACIVMHRNVWPIGVLTSEAWYNSGSADFAFAAVPGVFIEHGCIAPYSIAEQDMAIFWLSQDKQGKCVVFKGDASYGISEVSSKGIEYIFSRFATVDDAIGGCYMQLGHAFYVITFPTEQRTFAMELKTQQWHELAYTTQNGDLQRHRANCWTFAYGMNLIGDWQNGKIYQLDFNTFTDDGNPITRIRTFPHLMNEGDRFNLTSFMADLLGGTLTSATPDNPPKVYLRVSIDRGANYGNPIEGVFGAAGDYGQFPFWRNLGQARDFVLELTWSEPINTALNGGFYEAQPQKN